MQQTRNRFVRWGIVSLGFILVAVIVVGITARQQTDEEIGFTLAQTILNPTPGVGDNFGSGIAISGDKVLIGASWFDAATGNLLHTFLNPTPAAGDSFGSGIAISGDKVLIGASWFDAAAGNLLHTFLNPTSAVGDSFGGSVAISGDKVLIGAWRDDAGAKNSGAAYLFSPVPTNPR